MKMKGIARRKSLPSLLKSCVLYENDIIYRLECFSVAGTGCRHHGKPNSKCLT